jgi:hypothetical protein
MKEMPYVSRAAPVARALNPRRHVLATLVTRIVFHHHIPGGAWSCTNTRASRGWQSRLVSKQGNGLAVTPWRNSGNSGVGFDAMAVKTTGSIQLVITGEASTATVSTLVAADGQARCQCEIKWGGWDRQIEPSIRTSGSTAASFTVSSVSSVILIGYNPWAGVPAFHWGNPCGTSTACVVQVGGSPRSYGMLIRLHTVKLVDRHYRRLRSQVPCC